LDASELRAELSEEQWELLHALDCCFLRRSEWAIPRDRPESATEIADELVGNERSLAASPFMNDDLARKKQMP
jgi:hypothetical protein